MTGETLTLKFSPQGALSSARLDTQDVTSCLRYLRVEDFEEGLDVLGFKAKWETAEENLFSKLDEKLDYFDFSIFNVEKIYENRYNVFLTSKKDPSFIHKKTLAVLNYNTTESKFAGVVRLFEMDHITCNELLEERWTLNV